MPKKSHPLKRKVKFSRNRILIFALIFAVIGTSAVAISLAARSTVSGTIALRSDLSSPSGVSYGDTVRFDTSVSGRMAPKGYLVISLVCVQDRNIVYQVSAWDLSAGFTLVDQDGQNLEWDGGPARCRGSLVYRIDGRNPTIEYLAEVLFQVN